MVQALENMGLVPLQFRLDANRPDLQKLDSLLGLLATESSTFTSQITAIASQLQGCGLTQFIRNEAEAASAITTTTTTTTTPSNLDTLQNQLGDLDFTEEDGRNVAETTQDKGKGKQPDQSVRLALFVVYVILTC